ncbi:MAG: hypothetical protein AAGC91_01080 [Pseudomonadota bacterium]
MSHTVNVDVTLPSFLRPIHAKRLISIGGSSEPDGTDGNYVIPQDVIDATEVLVSYGINDDWTFESAMQKAAGATVYAYDQSTKDRFLRRFSRRRLKFNFRKLRSVVAYALNTIRGAPQEKREQILKNVKRVYFPSREFHQFFDGRTAHFYAEFIGRESDGLTSVTRTLKPHQHHNVMLKMDIEGSEYDVMDELLALPHSVCAFLAEFHNLDDPHKLEQLQRFTENTHLKLVHIHANNCAQLKSDNGTPPVLELTYVDPKFFEASGESPSYPISGLDVVNRPSEPDFELRFAS